MRVYELLTPSKDRKESWKEKASLYRCATNRLRGNFSEESYSSKSEHQGYITSAIAEPLVA